LKIKKDTRELEIAVVGKARKSARFIFPSALSRLLRNYLDKRTDMDEALFINYKPGKKAEEAPRRLSNRAHRGYC